jgi:hypothetical protein
MFDFSGRWFTSFGPMELTQDGRAVHGSYDYGDNECPLEGELENGRLRFTYREPDAAGEGWFELLGPSKFRGQWRPHGSETWGPWLGRRGFDGVWDTSFGLLRLVQESDRVVGFYEGLGPSTIEGRLQNNRLVFRYREPKAEGEGHFALSPDGTRFQGQWRAEGASSWAPWVGRRLAPAPGLLWLVVIEAHWQRSYLDKEYAFGNMLREFFVRLPHVHVRQRFFEDETGLFRWCRELMYVPEPVVVLIASHGTQEGLTVQGRPLDAGRIVDSLRYVDDLLLVHFSSCLMMEDGNAGALARALHQQVRVPVSGYDRTVDWAASALLEFHYLDMILGRGLPPAQAAEQLGRMLSYAGAETPSESPYPATGFRILLPQRG